MARRYKLTNHITYVPDLRQESARLECRVADKETKETQETFEDSLVRLEEIVEKMEGGGLGLEEAMKLYEDGVARVARLEGMLAEARDKVMKLVAGEDGELKLEQFDGSGGADERP